MNPRSFLKKMNNVYTHKEFEKLNRNKELAEGNIDQKMLLMKNIEKKGKVQQNTETLKIIISKHLISRS